MSKKSKALAGATAVAAGPSGLKRLFAGCLIAILLGGLTLTALLGFAAWTAGHGSSESAVLPCPPATVAVVWSTRDAPQAAREAVTGALRQAGRKPVKGGWGGDEERDLVVVWTPGSTTRVSGGSSPTTITLGAVPNADEITEALGTRLAPCEAPAKPSAAPAPAEAEEPAQEAPGGVSWPWERGWSLTGWIGLAVATWWLAGPNVVRAVRRTLEAVLWPLRLGWRRAQRWGYRRRLAQGLLPAEWPMRLTPGQRWHEDEGAMRDRRTFRAQIAEGEPKRRAALRASIRAERLEGIGIGPASIWRVIYRTPAHDPEQGAPETEGVST